MNADPTLVVAWLVLAHLVADFILQTDAIVAAKTSVGRRALVGLLQHGVGVALVLVPLVVAFGLAGMAAATLIVVGHLVVDRSKIVLTGRAEARSLRLAERGSGSGSRAVAGLDRAWTSVPAGLFVIDQAAHLGLIVLAWAIWLDGAPLTTAWRDAVGGLVGRWPPADVHRAALVAAVGLSLLIVNVRAASLLVATLVNPRSALGPHEDDDPPDDDPPGLEPPSKRALSTSRPTLTGTPTPNPAQAPRLEPTDDPDPVPGSRATTAPPARIGEAIGILERLVVVTLVLTGSTAAIGFVIAAKTLARFRQLDDRAFAEYYLLGTLASVTIALLSGLVAAAVLG